MPATPAPQTAWISPPQPRSGLPLRPVTVGHLLGQLDALDTENQQPLPELARLPLQEPDDPGWALIVSQGMTENRDRPTNGKTPWSIGWPRLTGAEALAVDRLWRFSVASGLASRRLALEQGDPDPDVAYRAGLLHRIGLWQLAATDPNRLVRWLSARGPEQRSAFEQSWFGQRLAEYGYRLARRWGAEPDVADAALWAVESAPEWRRLAHHPERLAQVRAGCRWAEQTPWSLNQSQKHAPSLDCQNRPARQWLTAAVQARCSGGFLKDVDNDVDVETDAWQIAGQWADRWSQLLEDYAELTQRHEALLAACREQSETQQNDHRQWLLDALGEFAAGAAHELNNPLAVVMGRAQLLQARQDDPEVRKSLQTIIGQARRAHQILRDLMYVARPPKPRIVPCLPEKIIMSSVDDLKPEARDREIVLTYQAQQSTDRASTDPDALRHLVDALVRNALEATPAGGSVAVRSWVVEDSLLLEVTDSGHGLDNRQAAHLFSPFYCGREAGRGLGLGLPRAVRFLEQVGGALTIDNHAAGGTQAQVRLPIAVEPTAVAQPGPEDQS